MLNLWWISAFDIYFLWTHGFSERDPWHKTPDIILYVCISAVVPVSKTKKYLQTCHFCMKHKKGSIFKLAIFSCELQERRICKHVIFHVNNKKEAFAIALFVKWTMIRRNYWVLPFSPSDWCALQEETKCKKPGVCILDDLRDYSSY